MSHFPRGLHARRRSNAATALRPRAGDEASPGRGGSASRDPLPLTHARRARRRWLLGALVLLMIAAGLAVARGASNARATPVVRHATIRVRGYPPTATSVRIALLSDLHLGNRAMDAHRLASIVGQVNAARPDLIVVAGDFVAGHDDHGAGPRAADLTAPLQALHAPLGVVAVLGNHDYWTAPSAVRNALERAGVQVLENQAVRRGPFAVTGIGDRFSGHDDINAAVESARAIGGVPLVLTHSPDLVRDLPNDLPLVLAGHTHCGQIVLPGNSPLITRSPRERWRRLYDPRYRCGVIWEGGRTMIVTAGLGSGTVPIRMGAMPDWWFVTVSGTR